MTHEELEKKVEKIQNFLAEFVAGDSLHINIPVAGGLDDGRIKKVPIKTVLLELMLALNFKPEFKEEIVFGQTKGETSEDEPKGE